MSLPPLGAVGVALQVAAAFEATSVRYFLGGSLASSLQGEPRSTNDIDFVVEMGPWKVAGLVAALGIDFSVDDVALRAALTRGGTANFFYLPLAMKIDLFARGQTPFDDAEFERRRRLVVDASGASLWVKTPEDSVLRKLRWYLDGGSVSERQWRDVVAILRVSAQRLDEAYLDRWAAVIGVADLLERARRER